MVARNIRLPNVRKMFIPDPGFTIFDADLAGADAQIVAWEADEERLKDAFKAKKKVHIENARLMWPDRTNSMTDAEIKDTSNPGGMYYDIKRAVHATNYGGKPPTIATVLKWPVRDAEDFQRRWFYHNPGILEWHRRTERHLSGEQCWNCNAYPDNPTLRCTGCGVVLGRTVKNKFGFRRRYFERPENLLPAALAWNPQSSVAICTELGWMNLFVTPTEYDEILLEIDPESPLLGKTHLYLANPEASHKWRTLVQALLQVHDSFVGQIPTLSMRGYAKDLIPEIVADMAVRVPYDDPLTIGMDFKISELSWGDC